MKKSVQLALMVAVVIFFGILIFRGVRSGYTLSSMINPSDLVISSKGGEASEMQNLPYKLECVPGPQETASPYTKSLTPGGYCGIQEFVKSQADYVITGGIGESLLA